MESVSAYVFMRTLYRNLRMALTALRRHGMRSVLTCIGITIGVAAVITMMEVVQGSSTVVRQRIASLGANRVPWAAAAATLHSGK